MEEELALLVLIVASRAGSDLANLPPLLKRSGDDGENDKIKHAIGSAIYEIGLITQSVFEKYPHLRAKSGALMEKYGRTFLE